LNVETAATAAHAPEEALTDAVLKLQADLSYAALERGRVDGAVSETLSVGAVQIGPAKARGMTLAMQWPALKADLGGRSASGAYHLRATLADVAASDASASAVSAEGSGRLEAAGQKVALDWTGSASGTSGWTGLGPATQDDAPLMVAIKHNASAFRWDLAKVRASFDNGQLTARVLGPARIDAGAGGRMALDPDSGGHRLTISGGSMPDVTAQLSDIVVGPHGLAIDVAATVDFSLGILQEASVTGRGRVVIAGAEGRLLAADCMDIAIKRISVGDNDLQNFDSRLCPDGKPMITATPGRWSVDAALDKTRASAPFLEAAVAEGSGAMHIDGRGAAMKAAFVIDTSQVTDLARPLRFHPLTAKGHADATNTQAAASLDIRPAKVAAPIAHAELTHDLGKSAGEVKITVANLTFDPGGLQPTDISPLTAVLGEPASGVVDFTGRVAWNDDKITSGGRLTARDLAFTSPLGAVTGVNGSMTFTDLLPLTGETDGPITAAQVAGPAPMTGITARAKIDAERITVTGAEAAVGGGLARFDASADLTGDQTVKGLVRIEKVELHDMVQASPIADKFSLTAQVEGGVPFEITDGKLRIQKSTIKAIGPGRLSLKRTAFNPGGAATGPATRDNLATFGYQALEDLSFQLLDADVQSDPDGRLHTVFHIVGRHDPATRKEIRLTWRDLLSRDVLNKPMPLPSDTVVNLTLDTTLNLDDLVQARRAPDRQQAAGAVQVGDAGAGAPLTERRQ
jgi:hypothetical protein